MRVIKATGKHLPIVDESIEKQDQPLLDKRGYMGAQKASVEYQLRSIDEKAPATGQYQERC